MNEQGFIALTRGPTGNSGVLEPAHSAEGSGTLAWLNRSHVKPIVGAACRVPSRVGARGHPLLPALSVVSSFPQLANSSSIFTSQAKLYSFPMGFTNPQAKPGSLTRFSITMRTCKVFPLAMFALVLVCVCGGWLDVCLSKEAGCSKRTRIEAVLLLIRTKANQPQGLRR